MQRRQDPPRHTDGTGAGNRSGTRSKGGKGAESVEDRSNGSVAPLFPSTWEGSASMDRERTVFGSYRQSGIQRSVVQAHPRERRRSASDAFRNRILDRTKRQRASERRIESSKG